MRGLDLLGCQRFSKLSREAFEIQAYFLEPRSAQEALEAGYTVGKLEEALEAGILVCAEDPRLPAARLWESRCWSRAAYLLFSQHDLSYREPMDVDLPLSELSELRRRSIRAYQSERPYPEMRFVEDAEPVVLPRCEALPPSLDTMIARRSIRTFTATAVPASSVAGVLWNSTENVRRAEDSKADGDPYYLLNSFYTWLRVYVVIQAVEGIDRGVYQYDPCSHVLRHVSDSAAEDRISACIQHQEWIGGGGFCLFVVVDWERYMWLYRHSRAYINLLIQLGEFGQEVLQAAYALGLGGWMTPAITESKAAELLALDEEREDAMYFLKIGPRSGSSA